LNGLVLSSGFLIEQELQSPRKVENDAMDASTAHLIEQLKGKHILIVEDHPSLTEIFSKILNLCGVGVSQAESGKAALQKVEAEPPDIILLDLGLPDMNGLDVALRVRRNKKAKSVPIIAVSATSDPRENCLRVGCNDFIVKPFAASELLARMSSLM
jgi:two-component system, OmpR family, response regulator